MKNGINYKEVIAIDGLLILWVILLVVFVVLEAVTVQLVSIWFAIGCVGGIIANFCGASEVVQIIVVLAVSFVCLAVTKPVLKKVVKKEKIQPTNADRLIGQSAVVIDPVNNIRETGTVKIHGVEWNVRSADDSVIESGSVVKIINIKGSKLIVAKEKE